MYHVEWKGPNPSTYLKGEEKMYASVCWIIAIIFFVLYRYFRKYDYLFLAVCSFIVFLMFGFSTVIFIAGGI